MNAQPTLAPASTQSFTVAELQSEAFWRELLPDLSIFTRLAGANEAHMLTQPIAEFAARRMMLEGYFQERDAALIDLAAVLSDAIETLHRAGIPPVFIFLFDEAWLAFLRQYRMISLFLGKEYQVLPDFWAWRVDPAAGQAGWTPHRDKGRQSLAPNGAPLSLTVWIPLTDAKPLNGCMYILPANLDPVYGTENEATWQVDFPSIRALPASPGEYLCWNQAVLHWGAQSSPFAQGPRKSMALEFQRGDVNAFNQPLLGPLPNMDFESRLRLIGKQIVQYRHMYPLSPTLNTLAEELIGRAVG